MSALMPDATGKGVEMALPARIGKLGLARTCVGISQTERPAFCSQGSQSLVDSCIILLYLRAAGLRNGRAATEGPSDTMHIAHLELANFRKLLSVRLDVAAEKTLLVGANNSGKTSAMVALRRFLTKRSDPFDVHDITLCHWEAIDNIGTTWVAQGNTAAEPTSAEWAAFLPALDLWLSVAGNELHYVSKLLPSLDWTGGLLGIRLRLEPSDPLQLRREFVAAVSNAQEIRAMVPAHNSADARGLEGTPQPTTPLWPTSMMDFLGRRLMSHFEVRAYPLDPTRLVDRKRPTGRSLSSAA